MTNKLKKIESSFVHLGSSYEVENFWKRIDEKTGLKNYRNKKYILRSS